MSDQLSYASLDYAAKKKRTKRDVFLAEMSAVERGPHSKR
jgi:transposase, IS5 family